MICENCGCNPVCKEKQNFKEYVKQYLLLRNRSSLFDRDPICPYFIQDVSVLNYDEETEEEITATNTYDFKEELENIFLRRFL